MAKEKRWISSEILFAAIEEQLAENRQAVFVVTGMSMWPFLCHGRDQVIVEKCDVSKLKKGDIVLFQTPLGNYILHRITKLYEYGFATTGDGNCFRDGVFPYFCIKARVVSMIRKDKELKCDSYFWRLIASIWMALYPFRKKLLRFLRGTSQLKNRITKGKH